MVEILDRHLSLTLRGRVVLGVAVAATAAGHLFGGRSLNAVVMPAVALLVVGAVGVARIKRPRVDRIAPATGFADETVRVELEVATARPVAVSVRDGLADGLKGDPTLSLVPGRDGSNVTYEVTLARRGVHTLGPAVVTATDIFGLWERPFEYDETDTVVVFPRVHPLHEGADLLSGYVGLTDAREQFDGVREYQRGDALRDINWKASAKRTDFVVTEYAGEGATNTVTVAVERPGEAVDVAAEAAASVVANLLDAGLAVGLVLHGTTANPGFGPDHRHRLFELLARLEPGGPPIDTGDADVVVRGDADGVYLDVHGNRQRFGDLVTTAGAGGVAA